MKALCEKIAALVKAIANAGAGVASSGVAYEPKMPKQLKK